uniref:Uncharacterized protein n=1 Tax=Leersia perrieri TaxID=77586 RepID=A0A0D9VEE7_9ORYZ
MARLSVTAVLLLAVVVVAHCHVTDGEVVGQPGSSDPEDAAVLSGAGNEYVRVDGAAGTSVYFVNDRVSAGEDGEAAAAARPVVGHHHPCRHGHRHHGLLGLRHGDGEAVLPLPVAEPDPDSRTADSAAVSLQEVQKTESHGEEEEAWRRFHHHRHHHHHHDEHEKAAAADQASPMKRFRFRHHEEEEHEHEQREEEEDSRSKRLRRHHHDKEDEDSHEEETELEEMARRLIRKALMRGGITHHGHRRFHHHLRFHGHRAAEEEEEKGGVMKWIKDFVNQF